MRSHSGCRRARRSRSGKSGRLTAPRPATELFRVGPDDRLFSGAPAMPAAAAVLDPAMLGPAVVERAVAPTDRLPDWPVHDDGLDVRARDLDDGVGARAAAEEAARERTRGCNTLECPDERASHCDLLSLALEFLASIVQRSAAAWRHRNQEANAKRAIESDCPRRRGAAPRSPPAPEVIFPRELDSPCNETDIRAFPAWRCSPRTATGGSTARAAYTQRLSRWPASHASMPAISFCRAGSVP